MAHTAVAKKQSEPKMSRALVRQETIAGYLFLLPSLIFFIGFVIYPMVMCIFTSFFDSSMNRADVFIGLQNYVELFHDSVFLGALAIFTFINSWNDYFMQLIMLSSTSKLTISLGIAKLQAENSTDYGLIMAGAALAAVPIIIVFLAFQKYFTKGITMGAVKG